MDEVYFLGTAAQRVQVVLSGQCAQVCGEMPPGPAWLWEGHLGKPGDLEMSVWVCSAPLLSNARSFFTSLLNPQNADVPVSLSKGWGGRGESDAVLGAAPRDKRRTPCSGDPSLGPWPH